MKTAVRGAVLTFQGDPFVIGDDAAVHYHEDSIVRMEDGLIREVRPAGEALGELDAGERLEEYPGGLILPGFIDCHVHYPQTGIIASYGTQLLEWLEKYAFPEEGRFRDPEYAARIAGVYLGECFRNGITSACVFCTVFPQSVDALFAAAEPYAMRLMAGKVLMDRNAPPWLLDTPQKAYDDSKRLIHRRHKTGRFEYVMTPRFALTSSPEQLEVCAALAAEHPDMLIQSHISENPREIDRVRELFPDCADYADVYARYGLMRPRAIYGHGIHMSEREWDLFRETGAAIAHCPNSNLFVGSGCFDIRRSYMDGRAPIRTGLATDIGGGDSFSPLRCMAEAYKVAQLNGYALSPVKAFYLATRGAARALYLDDRVGSLEAGMEADVVILDLFSTPLIRRRMATCESLAEQLFVQMILGDERAVAATYVSGRRVFGGIRPLPEDRAFHE
ncbi:MAG: guanine deaminase [Methylobacteriaceae bacterium]|nr:guanine deaminase [Methylobacteriaceae bacterium]